MILSIIIPVYNEEKTLLECIRRVQQVELGPITKEIVIIDDGSSDQTPRLLKEMALGSSIKILTHPVNRGKGAAVKTALQSITGDIVLIQDADLEYDPQDYPALIEPILKKKTRVVYGSRILRKENPRGRSDFYFGGRLISWFASCLYGCSLTDEPTCYKVFETDLIRSISIESDDFTWEPEITAKVLRSKNAILEVPIFYYPRSTQEGKKICALDGFKAIATLIKHKFNKMPNEHELKS